MAGVDVPIRPSPGVMLALRGRLCNMVVNRMHRSGDGDIVVPQRALSVVGTSSWVVEDPDDLDVRPINVRRLLALLRRAALLHGTRYVFEPNDDSLRRRIQRERRRHHADRNVRSRASEVFRHSRQMRFFLGMNEKQLNEGVRLAENRADRTFEFCNRALHGDKHGNHTVGP